MKESETAKAMDKQRNGSYQFPPAVASLRKTIGKACWYRAKEVGID
jgi:hypothetical protein